MLIEVQALNYPKSTVLPSPSDLPCDLPPMISGQRGNSKLTMIARRTIHPGEELTITYVNYNMPRLDRRAMLRELYGFWCNCPRCVREEGKEGDDADGIMRRSKENAQEMIDKMKFMPGFEQTRDEGKAEAEAKGHQEEAEDGNVKEGKDGMTEPPQISGWSPQTEGSERTDSTSEEAVQSS